MFLQGKVVSNTIPGKLYKVSWLKMHFYAVSKTPLSFYCSSGINSTVSTLWNAIYRRNKWSCSPVLGFAGSRWAVFYTWQLCTEKKREKKTVWNDCGVCVAPWNIKQRLVRPGSMIWTKKIRVAATNRPFLLPLSFIISGMGIAGAAAAAAFAGNVGLGIFLGWLGMWSSIPTLFLSPEQGDVGVSRTRPCLNFSGRKQELN